MESKEGLGVLFRYAVEGILVINKKKGVVRANPSAEKLFGYTESELTGKPIVTLIPRRMDAGPDAWDVYLRNPYPLTMGTSGDLYGLKKDGTDFPIEVSLSPYESDDGEYVIIFVIDVTDRKLAEDRLRNYSADLKKQVKNRTLILEEAIVELEKTKMYLNHSLEKERELNELKSRFVSIASHEFRTPLTTMMSSLSLISRYAENGDLENQQKYINKIKKSINDLTDILDDFLSVSKLEEGRVQNVPEQFNLRFGIEEIISEMRPFAVDGQELRFSYTGEEWINLDRKLLKHTLFNLISNAVKFSRAGEPVDIIVRMDETEAKIVVRDYGIGIPEADQKHLFERFFRAKNALNIRGTGLGLSIVDRYTELMGGTIDFESTEGKGTAFTIRLLR